LDQRVGSIIFTTVDEKGTPNSIYVTCVNKISPDKIVIEDNKFHKTRENISAGRKASAAQVNLPII
jgi:predicted pyridoxine 5'-phosphate oxidase superfamily flavin-nucleotide-binding protein